MVKITTEMLRKYLVEYQSINNCGKVTIDNIRRSLSTFFSWMEEEDYIIKSLMKRIHKVKTAIIVKDTIPNEKVEILRDNCNNLRDRAMINFLLSTGIRVGELVRLNISDIDFSERECVVLGVCETIIFYMKVIQKNQNTAGTLSLRSARSGTKFATSRSLSTDGHPSTCLCICFF